MNTVREWVALLTEIGFAGLFDIITVTLMIYAFLAALKRTQRSGLIFTGIVIVGAIYLIARKLNLLLTVTLLQGFFTVFLARLNGFDTLKNIFQGGSCMISRGGSAWK